MAEQQYKGLAVPLSFEFFPPSTDQGVENVRAALDSLAKWRPEFFSVTYGAGGGTRRRTLQTVSDLEQRTGVRGVPHLSCVGSAKDDILRVMQKYKAANIESVVALRGDLPSGIASGDLRHAADLVRMLREVFGNSIHINVAAHPEVHRQSDNASQDIEHFYAKVEAGADGAITQYFYNLDAYLYFRDAVVKRGVTVPIVPGIMPITNYTQLQRFSTACGAEIPRWLSTRLQELEVDNEALRDFGADVVATLCSKLLQEEAPGLHFYTLNRAAASNLICERLGMPAFA
ncbi:MAG: methylenetetrahydrofolate reductase [NAD(P)H] [Candidatus Porifericomitaceae bacterium WSBS_2022_MAG_OTU9]